MSNKIQIMDGIGSSSLACVTSIGQLVVAPLSYDDTTFIELAEPNVPFNFYEPREAQQFVITVLDLVADKQVSSSVSAEIVIYEATAEDTLTISKVLYQTAMVQDQDKTLSTNILVNEGVWINAKTTDDDIHMTIMGYYIPILT